MTDGVDTPRRTDGGHSHPQTSEQTARSASEGAELAEPASLKELRSRCPLCGNLGWVLDCNDLTRPGPRMAEFIECFHPECTVSGRPIQSVCFKGVEFQSVAWHPSKNFVMSVSNPSVNE